MSTAQEIESAMDKLPQGEFMALADRVAAKQADLWDKQIDSDSESGKLDFLFEEAEAEEAKGELREWPKRP